MAIEEKRSEFKKRGGSDNSVEGGKITEINKWVPNSRSFYCKPFFL